MRRSVHPPRDSKKAFLIGAITFVVAIIMTTLILSSGTSQWREQARRASQQDLAINKLQEKLVNSSREQRLKVLDALAVTARMECDGAWWYSWQISVSSEAKAVHKTCSATKKTAELITKRAIVLRSYLNDEHKIITLLNTISIDQTKPNWQSDAYTAVKSVDKELKLLSVDKTVEPVKNISITRIDVLQKAWEALRESDEKQDRDAYQSALVSLEEAYRNLAAITDVSDQQLAPLIALILL